MWLWVSAISCWFEIRFPIQTMHSWQFQSAFYHETFSSPSTQHCLAAPTSFLPKHHPLRRLLSQRKTSEKFLGQHWDDPPGSIIHGNQHPSHFRSPVTRDRWVSSCSPWTWQEIWPLLDPCLAVLSHRLKTSKHDKTTRSHGKKPNLHCITSRKGSHTGSNSLATPAGDSQQEPRIWLFLAGPVTWPGNGGGGISIGISLVSAMYVDKCQLHSFGDMA